MSRRSYTTIELSVKMRLPAGTKVPEALELVRDGIAIRLQSLDHQKPLAALNAHETVVKLIKRETVYL